MNRYKIDMKSYIYNGIEEEVENLEDNGDIIFSSDENRSNFMDDLQSEMLEQFEDDMEYFGKYNPDFADSVSDKIKWDHEFYGITVIV